MLCPWHESPQVAEFYCFVDGVYLCAQCFNEHRETSGHTHWCDSIKQHLNAFFNEWLQLHDYLAKQLIPKIECSMTQH